MINPLYPQIHVHKRLNFKFKKIINLQNAANNLLDAFTDYNGVMKLEILRSIHLNEWRYQRKSLRPSI
jgi:hypothetical protein